jgi:hypothetical protein
MSITMITTHHMQSPTPQRGFIFILLPILLLIAAAYGCFVWKWAYSEGERAGFVQKLSKKGFICKTWEGELTMVALPGAAPEKFLFTVWDDKVAEDINKNVGQRVALYYEEKVGIPLSCFGETRHYITKVKSLDIPATPAPQAVPVQPITQAPAQPAATLPPSLPATISNTQGIPDASQASTAASPSGGLVIPPAVAPSAAK